MESRIPNGGHWWERWWGVLLLGLMVLVVVVVLGFGFIVGYYFWQIKQGKGGEIVKMLNEKNPFSQENSEVKKKREDLELADSPFLGNPKADLVIVEFIDFKCPNCLAEDPIIRKVAQKYWSKVKIIVRDFPAESLHPGASELALLASCAHAQGKYWALHDIFFANQVQLSESLSEDKIKGLLDQAGVDFNQVKQCLSGSQVQMRVNRDYATGFKYGVQGTPTFFINGVKTQGVISGEAWDKFLGEL